MRLRVAVLFAIVVSPGCAAYDPFTGIDDDAGDYVGSDGGGAALDAGLEPSTLDASMGPDAAPPSGLGEFGARSGAAGDAAFCFDGVDNDSNEASDCEDLSCQQNVPSCCVGAGTAACCDTPVITSLPIAACLGELGLCDDAASLDVFGAPAPRVEELEGELAFIPGGDVADSGVLFAARHDPRREVLSASARVLLPTEDAPPGELDVIGVGFVDADVDPETVADVVPMAGFLVTRNRRELHFIVADEVVARFRLEDTGFESTYNTYLIELTVSPGGEIRLEWRLLGGTVTAAGVKMPLERALRGVAYGRTFNPTATSAPVRLAELSFGASACDIPDALDRESDAVVPAPLTDTSWADGHALSDPHVLAFEDPPGTEQIRMALMVDGEVHLAQPGAGGFELNTDLGTPALIVPSDDWALGGVDDPGLDFDGEHLWLYFVAYDASGHGSIARAQMSDVSGRFETAARVDGLYGDDSFEGVAPFRFRGSLYVAARVRSATSDAINLYPITADAAGSATELRRPSPSDLFAFDRDEVDAPSVLVHDDLARVYFAGRRGSRWSIGELVSADLALFNEPRDGAVFEGSGQGFDAVSVRDPAPFVDATSERIELYYSGSAGSRPRIGRASQPAP